MIIKLLSDMICRLIVYQTTVLILAAPDVDSLCAVTILTVRYLTVFTTSEILCLQIIKTQTLLRSDFVQYKLIPVAAAEDMQASVQLIKSDGVRETGLFVWSFILYYHFAMILTLFGRSKQ